MPAASATVSLRLPAKIKTRIDKAAKARKTSRSKFMLEAVVARLDAPDPAAEQSARMKSLEEFMADLNEARKNFAPRSAEDIDAQVRENRGDV
jgi:uncharacterized protein (DUF1778 family)